MAAHPNAKASLVTTAIAAGILHVTNKYTHAEVSDQDALVAAGAAVTAVLFVGRRGVWPTLHALWLGGRNAVTGQPPGDEPG